ncbi:TlpA family protein disulfide reductase [Flavobacterium sp.]
MNHLKYILLLISSVVVGQSKITISGQFNATANKEITLKGFYVNDFLLLDKTKTDSNGNFLLSYPSTYTGAALIEIDNLKKVIVLLNGESFKMEWTDLSSLSSLKFINSAENIWFDTGLLAYQTTENKKSGISYLIPHYKDEPKKQQFFNEEMVSLNTKTNQFLARLPNHSYAKYYLNIRILIADLPLCASRYFERLPELENNFNQLDFADERLLQSGLYFELLEAYVIAMESYGDQQYIHLNRAIDAMLVGLKTQPSLAQNVTEYLFNLLEKRSLFQSSEHLALALLSDENCQLDDKHKALFEQYRKMSNGSVAPNILFANSKQPFKQLSEIKSNYKLVVFGASWCPKCNEDIPHLISFYQKWKQNYNLEIVFISLDTQKNDYEAFVKNFPWISSCDFKGWESQPAIDYCVFGTPTMYLLDKDHKILLKPVSPAQIETWLEYQ